MKRYQFTPEFSLDEAAALWCDILPYTQEADDMHECAFRATDNEDYHQAVLANATPEKKRYLSIFLMIHRAMATTNDQPQRQDKISRNALIEIANTLN